MPAKALLMKDAWRSGSGKIARHHNLLDAHPSTKAGLPRRNAKREGGLFRCAQHTLWCQYPGAVRIQLFGFRQGLESGQLDGAAWLLEDCRCETRNMEPGMWHRSRRAAPVDATQSGGARSIPREGGRAFLAAPVGVSNIRWSAAAARNLVAERSPQKYGVPAALHAGAVRHDRKSRREPVPIAHSSVQTEAVPDRLRGAGHRLPVFERGVGRTAACGCRTRCRTHQRRQSLQRENRAA